MGDLMKIISTNRINERILAETKGSDPGLVNGKKYATSEGMQKPPVEFLDSMSCYRIQFL